MLAQHRTATIVAVLAMTSALQAQQGQRTDTTKKAVPLAALSVTATRTEHSTFDTPQPITVIDSATLREKLKNGVPDLFVDIAGLDMSGVGPNQRRPEIRAQRGQRILLLQDGLRLNNTRRQQDFGEIPALAGIASVERVEVVRGPSSVLYGTDAIGGVVNLISGGTPIPTTTAEVHGAFTYHYGSAGKASTPDAVVSGRFGHFGVRASAAYRDAEDVLAPAGKFGNITLSDRTLVHDSGVRDRSSQAMLSYDLNNTSSLFTRVEFYSAERAGFGYIDPSNLGAGQPTIRILYPDQDYSRYSAGYRANAFSTLFANRAEVTTYVQRNTRHLAQNIFVPITPSANVTTNAFNFTDLGTVGGRLELGKAIDARNVVTYGLDAFRDRSENTDSSVTMVIGFGPPSTQRSNSPTVPNATFQSLGAFAQLESRPVERLTTVIGLRGQDVVAETRETAGITRAPQKGTDRTVVWSANALYRIVNDLNFITSVGRGFRAPNLVERFFEGAAPEGNGYQTANPSLRAEQSINVDLGLRYRRGPWFAESFAFRNAIHDAIKAVSTRGLVNGLPEFQNQNIARLRVDGVEATAGARSPFGVDGSLSFTRLIGKNLSDPGNPIGDSYSSKIVGDVAYRTLRDRVALGYTLRHQGRQKDVIIGTNPIGSEIPAFTVHSARASVRLFDRYGVSNRLALTVDNIGDKLYAEFPNASFFRPEPGRSVSLAFVTGF